MGMRNNYSERLQRTGALQNVIFALKNNHPGIIKYHSTKGSRSLLPLENESGFCAGFPYLPSTTGQHSRLVSIGERAARVQSRGLWTRQGTSKSPGLCLPHTEFLSPLTKHPRSLGGRGCFSSYSKFSSEQVSTINF